MGVCCKGKTIHKVEKFHSLPFIRGHSNIPRLRIKVNVWIKKKVARIDFLYFSRPSLAFHQQFRQNVLLCFYIDKIPNGLWVISDYTKAVDDAMIMISPEIIDACSGNKVDRNLISDRFKLKTFRMYQIFPLLIEKYWKVSV